MRTTLCAQHVHRAHSVPYALWSSIVLLLGTLLAACAPAVATPTTVPPTLVLTACGASAPLMTDMGTVPSAPVSVYLGGEGPIGYFGGGGPVGFSDSLFQRLYALAPATGATHWCDQFSVQFTYKCPPNAACARPIPPAVGQPTLVDGVLYVCVSDASDELFALDAATGRPRWSRAATCGVEWSDGILLPPPPPPVVGNLIYSDHMALDRTTGQTVWTTSLPVQLQAADSALVYGTGTDAAMNDDHQTVYALDARTGSLRWQQRTDHPLGTVPVVADGLLIVGEAQVAGGGASLYALDADTGALRWRVPLVTLPDNGATFGGSPVIAGGSVYVGTPDGLVALDARTGTRRWSLPRTQYYAPLVVGTTAYVGGTAGLWAVDDDTGHVKWTWNPSGNAWVGQPALADDLLVTGYEGLRGAQAPGSGLVVGVNPVTGVMLWQRGDIGNISPPTAG